MTTTLNKIREYDPCKDGWEKLLKGLGKTKADDEQLSLLTILDINGLQDTLWCFKAVKGYDREKRLFAVWCARQVEHLMKDEKSVKALDVATRYANGEATEDELITARDTAYAYAYAASDYAAYAASDSASDSAADAADFTASDSAVAVADFTASDSAVADMKENQEIELRRVLGEIENEKT